MFYYKLNIIILTKGSKMDCLENLIKTNKIKLFIFDCDGTLMDTLDSHYNSWNETYDSLTYNFISKQEFVNFYAGTSGDELISIINERLNYNLNIKDVHNLKNNIFMEKYLNKVQPIKKTLNIIKKYHGVFPFILASGGEKHIVHKLLDLNNLSHYFVDIISISDVNLGKPAPDLFLTASNRMQISPENCLVFEDAETGFQAAKNANMKYIDINSFNLFI